MSSNRFRIAFSFAGEKRDFVAEVADILAKQFGKDKILYDKYHEAEFADADLAFILPGLYKNETDLIVAVFCPDYDSKEWCGLEWRAIFSIIKEGGSKKVLLSRFDFIDGKGLFNLAGFIELNHKKPEQFADIILERLAINEGKPKDHYSKSVPVVVSTATTSIPHNLPALQPFFGRENELRKIAEALEPENRTWGALIDGPGGMGKTSLAVRAAYEASPKAFDKIVFVSLKSRELDDNGLRSMSGFIISGLAELFNKLARELGHPDITKAIENERPRLLLDAMRGTHTLLILDNLESLTKPERDTVFTFVKILPQGCKAILTSRGRIGSGAEELILEKLSEQAALDTLDKLAENNPTLAKTSQAERLTLYEETGGKPLLLRWTAGQIGRGSCLTYKDALNYLRSCPEGNDPLEFIFGDLIEGFTEIETQILCALTYFNLPAKSKHIADIAGCTEADADIALRGLSNRSLVVPSEELDTFTLVTLVADFLRKKRSEIITNTGEKIQTYTYSLVVDNGGEYIAHALLNSEWPTIAAALPIFLNSTNEKLQFLCNEMMDFFLFTGRWDEWFVLVREAENCAVIADDFYNAGWRAYNIAWVYYLRNQATEVLIYADRAEMYWQKTKENFREQALAIRLCGIGQELKEDYDNAIISYRKSLEYTRKIDYESKDVAILFNDIAGIQRSLNNYTASENEFKEALRIAKKNDYFDIIAIVTCNLAGLELDKGNWKVAETLSRESLELGEKFGRMELLAANCEVLALALFEQDKKSDAIIYGKRAVDILRRLKSPSLARVLLTLEKFKS